MKPISLLLIMTALLGTLDAQTTSQQQHQDATRLSLAQAGDHEALQYFACRTLTNNVFQIENLMRTDLDSIGGDFAIETYRQLLDSDSRFLPQIKKMRRKRTEDALPRLPSISVLFRLPKLLPGAGIPPSPLLDYETDPNQDFGLREKWRTWIDSHQAQIKELKPTTDGISFNPGYCSKFNSH
jgi:hypothetical protein